MEELKTYTLEELSKGKGSYGIAASAVPFNPNKHTYLRITDINDDGTLNKKGLMSVDEDNAADYLLEENDIVFARTGNSTGRTYFYDGSDGELVYAGFLIKFSLDENKLNPRILKYYTHSKLYYDWVHSFDTGGTRGNINAKIYGAMPIELPSREMQDRIVDIMKSLDDKIALNQRINDNLEQQAQALYRSWFIDFEPFKYAEFVESELGEIPEKWRVGKLSDIGKIVGGSTPSKSHPEYYTTNGIAWLTPKDLSGTRAKFTSRGEIDITEIGYNSCSTKMLPRGSVLFSSRAPIGYISIALNDICTNQGFKSIVPNKEIGTAFVYYYLKNNTSKIESQASGSTFKEVSGSLINSLPIVIPPVKLISKFNEIANPIFSQQEKNEDEIKKLSQLRDEILPKLMSGELKINDLHS
jgi:type I restriction enzyme S subunit